MFQGKETDGMWESADSNPPTWEQSFTVIDSPKVKVWCGIMCNRIIGPLFLNETIIIANVYCDLLTQCATPQLYARMAFKQLSFSAKWCINHIGAGMFVGPLIKHFKADGPVPSPPRPLDITLIWTFFWVYVKNILYKTKIQDIIYFKQRISGAIATINEATENVSRNGIPSWNASSYN